MGARETALNLILQRLHGVSIKTPRARLTDLPSPVQHELMRLHRGLGGVLDAPVLAPGEWDVAFADGLVVELDEDLHFNRYRGMTLDLPWADALPWTPAYRQHCLRGEEMCWKAGRLGGKWTSPSTVKMFGMGDPPGVFASGGSPRWKQRALYDAIKDAFAAFSGYHRLARLSIHDVIAGASVNGLLAGKSRVPESFIHEFLA